MKEYVKVIVPNKVDVDILLKPLELTRTLEKSFKDDIYLFISLIYISDKDYYRLYKNNGFTKYSSIALKNLFDGKRFYKLLNLLIVNGIVEKDKNWKNDVNKSKSYCQGYRICKFYLDYKSAFKTIVLKEKYKKYFASNAKGDLVNVSGTISDLSEYAPLLDQFDKYKLSLDSGVYDYLCNYSRLLVSKLRDDRIAHGIKNPDNLNRYQLLKLYSIIGRYIISITDFQNDKIWHNVSKSNNRFNTSITGLKKGFRNFITIAGVDSIYQIDVKSSQPYILASIMSKDFMTAKIEGYNLWTIYPALYEKLKDYIENDSISLSEDIIDINPEFIRKKVYEYTKALKSGNITENGAGALGVIKNYYGISSKDEYNELNSAGTLSIWGKFFNQKDIDSIVNYRKSNFTKDFYLDVAHEYMRISSISANDIDVKELRKKFKSTLMYILFDNNSQNRRNNADIRIFTNVFSGVNKWIEGILKLTSKKEFAYLMQRAESYLILKIVANEFINANPNAPVFTIHDAILTSGEYINKLERLLKKRLFEVTKIGPGADVIQINKTTHPDNKEIMKTWSKIRPVNSKASYDKAKDKMFDIHIEAGKKFVEENGLLPS